MIPLYLIFSHINPAQVVRLAGAIRQLSPRSKVVIHHDSSKSTFEPVNLTGLDSVYLIENPVTCEWGDFSQVQQYLHAFQWCRERIPEFDWVITLTGQSYPIRPLDDFELKLEHSGDEGFLYFFEASDPTHWPLGTSHNRHYYTYYQLPRFPYWYRVPSLAREFLQSVRKQFNLTQSLIRIMPFPKSQLTRIGFRRLPIPFPTGHRLFGGRQNMTLSRRSVEYVIEYCENNPDYVKFFRRTLNPDESFFLSILLNRDDFRFRNDLPLFTKWPRGERHAASCAIIETGDLPEILASGKYFALKFDQTIDAEPLSTIDRRLGIAAITKNDSSRVNG